MLLPKILWILWIFYHITHELYSIQRAEMADPIFKSLVYIKITKISLVLTELIMMAVHESYLILYIITTQHFLIGLCK